MTLPVRPRPAAAAEAVGDRFIALMSKHYPAWREARAELNELPLGATVWKE